MTTPGLTSVANLCDLLPLKLPSSADTTTESSEPEDADVDESFQDEATTELVLIYL